jgi:hypothetical protein
MLILLAAFRVSPIPGCQNTSTLPTISHRTKYAGDRLGRPDCAGIPMGWEFTKSSGQKMPMAPE